MYSLKLGTQTAQTEDQLLKLDEQVLTDRHKVGIMYCKAGQSTEEEMYNNESAGPAFNEFLDLIGTRIRLKGFDKYTGGLDNKGLYSFKIDRIKVTLKIVCMKMRTVFIFL